jgi:glucose-6-phosphate 1-dehydrogenase
LTEVLIQFKGAPLPLFRGSTRKPEPNILRLRIPARRRDFADRGAEKTRHTERPDPGSNSTCCTGSRSKSRSKDAYERLLLDALNGDAVLFMREDEIDAAWRVVDPLLAYWNQDPVDFPNYAAGTWGPEAADELLARDGRKWLSMDGF